LAAFLAGCTARPERPLLERFFEASRLRDRAALQHLSTVTFEPHDQGIITAFDVVGVTSEERNGEIVNKNVTVVAPVELSNGQIEKKKLIITMQKRDKEWIVTGVVAQDFSPAAQGR
jgi:hypothetical protein